jgi:hypothetical protein
MANKILRFGIRLQIPIVMSTEHDGGFFSCLRVNLDIPERIRLQGIRDLPTRKSNVIVIRLIVGLCQYLTRNGPRKTLHTIWIFQPEGNWVCGLLQNGPISSVIAIGTTVQGVSSCIPISIQPCAKICWRTIIFICWYMENLAVCMAWIWGYWDGECSVFYSVCISRSENWGKFCSLIQQKLTSQLLGQNMDVRARPNDNQSMRNNS